MPKSRKQYSPSEKAAILREHLIDHLPVSDVCDKHGIHTTLSYQWQKMFFENLHSPFDRKAGKPIKANHHQIGSLQRKLTQKDEVIATIMEDFIAVKKDLGKPEAGLGFPFHPRRGGGLCPSLFLLRQPSARLECRNGSRL